jgi:membrane protein YdbS with pleckstrin-like domain
MEQRSVGARTGDGGFRRLSPRFWLARQTLIALLVAPPLGVSVAIALMAPAPYSAVLPPVVAAIGVFAWMIERGRYRSWGYAEREDDLIVRRGLLFRKVSVVPYGRMQFIDVTAGPLDRAFGLATVQLHTAAAATDARIPGLRQQDADHLRDRLAKLGEARASGL